MSHLIFTSQQEEVKDRQVEVVMDIQTIMIHIITWVEVKAYDAVMKSLKLE